jgi:hypothetical protein
VVSDQVGHGGRVEVARADHDVPAPQPGDKGRDLVGPVEPRRNLDVGVSGDGLADELAEHPRQAQQDDMNAIHMCRQTARILRGGSRTSHGPADANSICLGA